MDLIERQVHVEWGLEGADAVAAYADVAVVVDILSFTTSVSVAVDRNVRVLPYTEYGATAEAFAERSDAVVAGLRAGADELGISLSPLSIRQATTLPRRLVLPSPNGSSIAHRLAATGATVVAACLRNADAVAAWISQNHPGSAVAVIAAGERRAGSGHLRPAIEDFWGAGAVIMALHRRGWRDFSVEAAAATRSVPPTQAEFLMALQDCTSGRELVNAGFREDVLIAGEFGASDSVPLLNGDMFVPAPAVQPGFRRPPRQGSD